MLIAKIGQTAESGHPGRLRDLSDILFGTTPKLFPERFGEETLQRDASRGGDCLDLPEQSARESDCGPHPLISP